MTNTLMHYVEQGGVLMYILVGLNVLGLSIMLFKFLQLKLADMKASEKTTALLQSVNKAQFEKESVYEEHLINLFEEHLFNLEKGLNTVKIIASIAPLLGLLGTVLGVLNAFESIAAQKGVGDVSVFASGISMALITTVGGLVVAIPHYIGYNYLIGMLNKLSIRFDAQLILKK